LSMVIALGQILFDQCRQSRSRPLYMPQAALSGTCSEDQQFDKKQEHATA
jgi:hypothetical protein